MNLVRKTLIGALLLVLLSGSAFAVQQFTHVPSATDYFTMPDGLDEVYTDSLLYHNFTGGYYYPSTAVNFSIGVRYTPPVEFELQALRFYAHNSGTIQNVEARVYTNNGGQPGVLVGTVFNGPPSSVTSNWVELALDEEDVLQFDAGEDFWVVIGNIPGNANGGWSAILDQDGAAPGARSKWSTTGSWTNLSETAPYDWVMNALGAYSGTFYDISVVSLFNDIQAFHFEAETEVVFTAGIRNSGLTASPEGTVTFNVEDSDGEVIFTSSTTVESIGGGNADTVFVTAPEAWTPWINGRYIANVVVVGDEEEGDTDNNEYLLLQEIVEVGDWFGYDDGEFETSVSNQVGNGWAVPFYPISYPARIDSVSWFFNTASDGTDLRVMTFTPEGLFEVWQYTGPTVQGWNTFEINDEDMPDGINIADGMFIGVYVMTTAPFMSDNNPPTSAANPHMPDASFSYATGSLYLDDSGNWGIRAKIVEGSEPAAPHFVFPVGAVDFGEAVVGEETVTTIDIVNEGMLFGTVTDIVISSTIADEVRVISELPFRIEAESTGQIEIGWTPDTEGTMPTAGVLVHHSALNVPSPRIVPVTGNASASSVGEKGGSIPSEYSLAQNHPNPFNPSTEIRFGLPQAGDVRVTLYNVMGQEIAKLMNGRMNAGYHSLTVDGRNLSSGIYFYALDVNGFHSMKKMVLMK